MESSRTENKRYLPFLVLLSIILVLLGSRLDSLRNYMSYLYKDVSYSQVVNGRNIRNYFNLFSKIIEIKEENESLLAENTRLKSALDSISFVLEDNEQLRKMDRFTQKNSKYIESRMFLGEGNEVGYINLGSGDGIKKNSVVQYGEYYVGLVDRTDTSSAVVKLPYSRSSFIKVSIVKPISLLGKDMNYLKKIVSSKTKSTAVVIGKGDRVVVENISMDKGVADGDLIITSDDKIGKYLIVGTVVDINRDPASSSITSGIKISVNYQDLNRYMIEIE